MKSDDHFVHGGGQRYGGRPMTRLFGILSFFGLGFLIVASVALYDAGWPVELFSPIFWFCIMLIVAEVGCVVLAVRFALTEKPHPRPKDAYDIRKMY
jgi:hypothetical protein